jgi:hypothetical protein
MIDIKGTFKKFELIEIGMALPVSAITAREKLKRLSMPYYLWSIAHEPLGPGDFLVYFQSLDLDGSKTVREFRP